MKCQSCNEDVPSKFAHAFTINVCPLCGDPIMDEKLQSLMKDLKQNLTSAKSFEDQINDWMFSNFGFKKIKDDEVVISKSEFERLKNQPVHSFEKQHKNQEAQEGETFSDEAVKVFAKRANVPPARRAIDFIKGASGAAPLSEFKGTDEYYGDVDAEEDATVMNPLSQTERRQMSNVFNGDGSQYEELEKIKQLKGRSAILGGGGGFRRS